MKSKEVMQTVYEPEVGDKIYCKCHPDFVVTIILLSSTIARTDSRDSGGHLKECLVGLLYWDLKREMFRYRK